MYLGGFILSRLVAPIEKSCSDASPLETMGFLLGRPVHLNDVGARRAFAKLPSELVDIGSPEKLVGSQVTYIENVITGPTDSTRSHVRFNSDVLARISYRIRTDPDYRGMFMIGWYHSHPGYGCFMSQTDENTQRNYFSKDYHLACVHDPVRREWGWFKLSQSTGRCVPVIPLCADTFEMWFDEQT